MTAVREDAVAAWRRAEARVYPTVMVDAAMYEQYLTLVRAVADELADVRTEDELVTAWEERREVANAVVARQAPSMRAFMDIEAVRDAAFCHRHREITRARGKEIARERLEQAWRDKAEWVVLFDDVTPLGSHRLEMHVRTGRGLHASCKRDLDRPPTYSLEVVQLDPGTGTWLLDKPPLMPTQTYGTPDEWEARIAQAKAEIGKD